MIWDLIRDWFVQYIWGGVDSANHYYATSIGKSYSTNGGNSWEVDLGSVKALDMTYDNRFLNVNGWYSLADWLSTTSTIITLIILVVVFFLFIRYLYRLTAGLIRVH